MAIDVVSEVLIKRPRDRVAAYVMDPANDPVWIGGIVEAKPLTEMPVRVGSRVSRIATFLGKRIEYILEVTEHIPGALLGMQSVAGPFPMQVSYEFEETAGGTRVRVRNRGEVSGFFKLAEGFMARSVQRNVTNDLETLKDLLEE